MFENLISTELDALAASDWRMAAIHYEAKAKFYAEKLEDALADLSRARAELAAVTITRPRRSGW
jgi:hypothetical protein